MLLKVYFEVAAVSPVTSMVVRIKKFFGRVTIEPRGAPLKTPWTDKNVFEGVTLGFRARK